MDVTLRELAVACGGELLCGDPEGRPAHIITDSRTVGEGDLFVPLIGEKNNAHRFVPQAFEAGAMAVLASEDVPLPGGGRKAVIRVADTLAALQDIGRFLRTRLGIPLIGITGSVGKTTTREMTALALSGSFRTFRTPANHNSQVGVPVTISEIAPDDEIGVIELGMSEPGEMSRISDIARVNAALITNIGVAHIENLGSRENILAEKLHIQDGMPDGGILIVNGDNDMLKNAAAREGIGLIRYGLGEENDCRAEHVRMEGRFTCFDYVHGDRSVPVKLQVFGEHMVLDALAAMTAADVLGADLGAAAEKLAGFHGFKGRQQIFVSNGITVIDDTYNASPDSMRASLRVLSSLPVQGRRIAVLADMLELGKDSDRFHREIGAFAANMRLSELLVYGQRAVLYAKGAFAVGGFRGSMKIEAFEAPAEKDELIKHLKAVLKPGDAVLFKGSNSMKLGEICAHFIDRNGES